jgi:PAS domain S-box-containing protein
MNSSTKNEEKMFSEIKRLRCRVRHLEEFIRTTSSLRSGESCTELSSLNMADDPTIGERVSLSHDADELRESLYQETPGIKTAEAESSSGKQWLELAVYGADIALWHWDIAENRTTVNEKWHEMFGYTEEDPPLNFEFWKESLHPDDRQRATATLQEMLAGESTIFEGDYRVRTKSGDWKWVMEKGKVVERDEQGRPLRMTGSTQDITNIKKAEQELQAAIREKTLLLRELHHRTKNNLQVISSLIRLGFHYNGSENFSRFISKIENQIHAMALAHESIYRSKDLEKINIGKYTESVVGGIFQTSSMSLAKLTLNMDFEDFYLGIDQAVPLGLMINELVTNSIVHGLSHSESGNLLLRGVNIQGNKYELTISDDGAGLPEGFDTKRDGGFGFNLARILSNQIKAELEVRSESGVQCVVLLPCTVQD